MRCVQDTVTPTGDGQNDSAADAVDAVADETTPSPVPKQWTDAGTDDLAETPFTVLVGVR